MRKWISLPAEYGLSWRVVVASWSAVSLLLFAQLYGWVLAGVSGIDWERQGWRFLVLVTAIGLYWVAVTPAILGIGLRWPLRPRSWVRPVLLRAAVGLAIAAAGVGLAWTINLWVYDRPIPFGGFLAGNLERTFLRFVAASLAAEGVLRFREALARDVTAAELERTLADARLRTVRTRIDPGFVADVLGDASRWVTTAPARAEALVAELSDLLRAKTAFARQRLVPLETEMEAFRAHARILHLRGGPEWELEVDPALADEGALVPGFILQHLTERCCGPDGHATVRGRVRLARDGDELRMDVAIVSRENGSSGAAGVERAGHPPLLHDPGLAEYALRTASGPRTATVWIRWHAED